MATYEELRQKHMVDARSLYSEYAERLSWSAERIHQEREEKLRTLVRLAKERSPWHHGRLADIEPETLTEADLDRIPPMTKGDLMDHWDEIVTDRRLTLDLVNSHLDSLTTDQYLFDEYHAVASGGSTGHRGVFLYDWVGWLFFHVMFVRWAFREWRSDLERTKTPPVRASIAAEKATHITSAQSQTFSDSLVKVHRFPVTLPIQQIVDGLNKVQPASLGGYPSALYLLSHEARAGRLRISSRPVNTAAEPLLPEIRAALEDAWGVKVRNLWACSEGAGAFSCSEGRGMHLNDDFCIVEPVDVKGKPVLPGAASAKIYLTNLYNHALPLIRYEVTDEVTILDEPCPCGSAHRRIDDVMGRLDDTFIYASGIHIHPHLFRSALGGERNILEYQVRQTRHGADISIRCSGDVDVSSLRLAIVKGLKSLGLEDPELSIAQVDRFERLATGKLKRFIPLAPL